MDQKVMFFHNGNTAVFEKGEQVPELQQPWFVMYLKFMEAQGRNPLDYEFVLPSGYHAKPFKTSEGRWNWELIG